MKILYIFGILILSFFSCTEKHQSKTINTIDTTYFGKLKVILKVLNENNIKTKDTTYKIVVLNPNGCTACIGATKSEIQTILSKRKEQIVILSAHSNFTTFQDLNTHPYFIHDYKEKIWRSGIMNKLNAVFKISNDSIIEQIDFDDLSLDKLKDAIGTQ